MSEAKGYEIASRGLNRPEREKYDRIAVGLSQVFQQAGCHTIQVCEGCGAGIHRTLRFLEIVTQIPIVRIPSAKFLTSTLEDLSAVIRGQLACRPAN